MSTPANTVPQITQEDLKDPTLFRLNNVIQAAFSQLAGIYSSGVKTTLGATLTVPSILSPSQTTTPTDGNTLITLNTAESLFGAGIQRFALSTGTAPGASKTVQPISSGGIPQLSGDVTTPNPGSGVTTLEAIQGTPVSAASPSSGDILTYNGTDWVASAGASGSKVVNAAASSSPLITSAATTIPGTLITLNIAGVWLVRGYILFNAYYVDNVLTGTLILSPGGSQLGAMEVACPGSGNIGRFQASYEWVATVTGTSTTAALQVAKSGTGGTSSALSVGTAIIAEWIHA